MKIDYRLCARCVMDTSDPDIVFDENGHCNHCTRYMVRVATEVRSGQASGTGLEQIIDKIRLEGRGRDYDCVTGVSGGVDSTYVIYHLKKLGLRPLAVHFDNGWNSELAVANIKNALDRLNIDLDTTVVEWEEFKDLQLSFLKASVPNCEIPTDHAITATLVKAASKVRTRYVINGSNVATEGILPISWVYYSHDLYHMKAIHRGFGTIPIRSTPTIPLWMFSSKIVTGEYKMVNLLNYIPYDKYSAVEALKSELGWQYYGGKHYESVYTRWFQGYYLPTKFGFDKRRAHLSALVCAGQIERDSALIELERNPYADNDLEGDMAFVLKKFGLSYGDMEQLIKAPNQKHTDYPNRGRFIEGLTGIRTYLRNRAKTI